MLVLVCMYTGYIVKLPPRILIDSLYSYGYFELSALAITTHTYHIDHVLQ